MALDLTDAVDDFTRVFKDMSFFGWWKDTTVGARFDILRRATRIGTDDQGNAYFEEKKPSLEGRRRRYVIYNGLAEPSRIPQQWHGWLHYSTDVVPDGGDVSYDYRKQHRPNWTGTARAWRPRGSLASRTKGSQSTADYERWTPDE